MPRNQDRVDLMFSEEGDFVIDNQGDLADTKGDSLLSFRQEVIWRIKTQIGDWALHPNESANLDDIKGEPNTRETAETGTFLILQALTFDGFLTEKDVDIRPVPVSKERVAYFVTALVSPTEANESTKAVKVQLLLDYNDNGIVFV